MKRWKLLAAGAEGDDGSKYSEEVYLHLIYKRDENILYTFRLHRLVFVQVPIVLIESLTCVVI